MLYSSQYLDCLQPNARQYNIICDTFHVSANHTGQSGSMEAVTEQQELDAVRQTGDDESGKEGKCIDLFPV